MLLPADTELVRRDPDLPGLRIVLDPEAFAETLQDALPDRRVGAARIQYIRYKPHTKCLVAYSVEGVSEKGLVYARALRPRAPRSGRLVLDGRGIEVFLFPQDRILRSLHALGRGRRSRRRFFGDVLPPGSPLQEGKVRTLRYKPERRYVARLAGSSGESGVLRVYDRAGYVRARRAAGAFEDGGTLHFPRLLGHSDSRYAVVSSWVRGDLLRDALGDPARGPAAAASIGRALAEFHGREPEGLTAVSREAEASTLREVVAGLSALCPSVAAPADALGRALAGAVAALPPEAQPIHGDFNDTQALLVGEGAALLDLDEGGRGDPAADLGSFLARLERDVLQEILPAAQAAAIGAALLAGYRSRRAVVLPRVNLYVAVGLLRLAPLPFRLHEPDWPAGIAAILTRAHAALAGAQVAGAVVPA